MKVWHGAGTYSQRGLSPVSWLVAVARNHAIDNLSRAEDVASGEMSPEDAAAWAS